MPAKTQPTGCSDAIVAIAASTVPCISGGAWSKRASAAACLLENDDGDRRYVTLTTDNTTCSKLRKFTSELPQPKHTRLQQDSGSRAKAPYIARVIADLRRAEITCTFSCGQGTPGKKPGDLPCPSRALRIVVEHTTQELEAE
jgi:hypothetical protein